MRYRRRVQLDRAQLQAIADVLVPPRAPDAPDSTPALTPAEAELVVAIAQLAITADSVVDRDELTAFAAIAEAVYAQAGLSTSAPSLPAVTDTDARLDLLETHAAQLRDGAGARLAYGLAFAIVVADLELDPREDELLETLRAALGLEADTADEIATVVASIATPVA